MKEKTRDTERRTIIKSWGIAAFFAIAITAVILLIPFALGEFFEKAGMLPEQKKEIRIEAVAEELDVNKKNVLEIGEDSEGNRKYMTDLGFYMVDFDGKEIRSIVKGEKEND